MGTADAPYIRYRTALLLPLMGSKRIHEIPPKGGANRDWDSCENQTQSSRQRSRRRRSHTRPIRVRMRFLVSDSFEAAHHIHVCEDSNDEATANWATHP